MESKRTAATTTISKKRMKLRFMTSIRRMPMKTMSTTCLHKRSTRTDLTPSRLLRASTSTDVASVLCKTCNQTIASKTTTLNKRWMTRWMKRSLRLKFYRTTRSSRRRTILRTKMKLSTCPPSR